MAKGHSGLGYEGQLRPMGDTTALGQIGSAAAPAASAPATKSANGRTLDDSDHLERYREPEVRRDRTSSTSESPFVRVSNTPRSTFSVDVDTASYSTVRSYLNQGRRPPLEAIRIEELINSLDYNYPTPVSGESVAVNAEAHPAPWNPEHHLVRIGLKAADLPPGPPPPRNLVFLIDVSGSMNSPQRLPLVKQALLELVDQLNGQDRIGIVVYAGQSNTILDTTNGNDKDTVRSAIENLVAEGSTNGSGGIQKAYALARRSFQRGAVNRVILATDGDFNVGLTGKGALEALIAKERASGVYLSVLGFGMGNRHDGRLELLADKGNGNYAYIDSIEEARHPLIDKAAGTLVTMADDVKVQVEFNPRTVQSYRLIGYDNRRLANRDFRNDAKDAGEMGAGQTVTALYEIVPTGVAKSLPPCGTPVDLPPSRYGQSIPTAPCADPPEEPALHDAWWKRPLMDGLPSRTVLAPSKRDELLVVHVRYKSDFGSRGRELHQPVALSLGLPTANFHKAAAVTTFGLMLRQSPYLGSASYALARDLLEQATSYNRGATDRDRDLAWMIAQAAM